ncbi:unnamed protein product [Caenorhabditis angaria]|uniref:LEM domain-containing protein n=1 Tax=Caenorhabditis angaria TaxID=860376 RepID=A0A9P1I6U6_9PELO|nr:unnamed protein product [Caenorhabditis angaria]
MAVKKKETLHYLAMSSSTTAVDAARCLLENGANVSSIDKDGLTPLHYACAHDNVAMCQLLLTFGADPRFCDKLGRTPISVAKGNTLRFLRRFQKRDNNQRVGIFRRFFACHNPPNDTFFIRRPNGRSEIGGGRNENIEQDNSFNRGNAISRSYRQAKKKIRATLGVFTRRNSSVELQDTVMTSEGIRTINTPTRIEKRAKLTKKKSLSLDNLNTPKVTNNNINQRQKVAANTGSTQRKRSRSQDETWKTPRRKQVTPTAPPIEMYKSTSEEEEDDDKNGEKRILKKQKRKTSGHNTTAYFTADESLELIIESKMSKMTISEPNTPTYVDDGEMRKIKRMRDAELRKELKKYGISPAGQFDIRTRRLYEKKLLSEKTRIFERGYSPDQDISKIKYSPQLELVLKNGVIPDHFIARTRKYDEKIREEFSVDGFGYTAFCYLILDPRITGDNARKIDHWLILLMHGMREKEKPETLKTNEKLRKIDELWSLGLAIPRHEISHGISDEEAYVREACIIEAIKLNNLSNKKAGEFHGVSKNWDNITRSEYGVFLLNTALSTLKAEGFRYVSENKLPEQLYPYVNNNRRTPRTPK